MEEKQNVTASGVDNNTLMKRFLWLGILLSCSHIPNKSDKKPETAISERSDATDHQIEIAAEQVNKNAEEISESLSNEENFCYDSHYLKSLTESKRLKIKTNSRRIRGRQLKKKIRRYKLEVNGVKHNADIRDISSFPMVYNSRVGNWINYFTTRGRTTFIKWLSRSEGVRKPIMDALISEGMPKELFFLAMIESGFNAKAKSHAKAVGTWQFMRATAKHYGLRMNYFVDERRDPIKATYAASQFLTDLYSRFQDWHLAIAAYNAGPGKIRRAMRKLKTRSFWRIANSPYIRKETKNYVPKMIAAAMIGMNPKKYGFHIYSSKPFTLPSHYVLLDEPYYLNEIANILNVPLKSLKKWNPELKRPITPPIQKQYIGKNSSYSLRLPTELASEFQKREIHLSSLTVDQFSVHKIRPGETLSKIARKYRISVKNLLKFNPKVSPKRLRIGTKLAVPTPSVRPKKA